MVARDAAGHRGRGSRGGRAAAAGKQDVQTAGIRTGCEEAAGIVVEAQADVLRQHDHRGHWWILRIRDRGVDVLAHVDGMAVDDFMEWAWETTLEAVGLVDLDRDGTLDVLAAADSHEGGSSTHDVILSSILSRTHRTIRIAELDAGIELARRQHHRAGDPVVMALHDRGGPHPRDRARARLRGTDWSSPDAASRLRDPAERADLAAALTLLKADRALIAALEAL